MSDDTPELTEVTDKLEADIEASGDHSSRSAGGEGEASGSGAPAGERDSLLLRGDIHDRTQAVRQALRNLNRASDDPRTFRKGGDLVRLSRVDDRLEMERLEFPTLRNHIGRHFKLYQLDSDDNRELRSMATRPVVQNLLGEPHYRGFPRLRSVVHSPVYGRDWQLEASGGYHSGAQVWVDLEDTLEGMAPNTDNLEHSIDLLTEHLLEGFPFDSQASLANALALCITPFVRLALAERGARTPLFMVSAPRASSGKTKLSEAIGLIATGEIVDVMTEASGDDEWRKRITSQLRTGESYNLIDNINNTLDSGALAAALTQLEWSDRELGESNQLSLYNGGVWVATANNPQMSNEIATRTTLIRIVPEMENPESRGDDAYRHPNLLEWVDDNRGALIRACLTLIEHWIDRGMPPASDAPDFRFSEWRDVVGGILETAGIEGFLGHRQRIMRKANRERGEWKSFVRVWWNKHGRSPVKASELVGICANRKMLETVTGLGSRDSKRSKLGVALSDRDERIYAGYQIHVERDSHTGTNQYRLEPINPDD